MNQQQASIDSPPPAADPSPVPAASKFQIRAAVDLVMQDFWKAVMRIYNSPRPYTGITSFDALTCGLAPGVHILAGRPHMGKTSLMLNMVENMCVNDKLPCLIFSGDHTSHQLTHRLIFSRAWLPTRITYAVANYPDESEKDSLRKAASDIASAPIHIDDSFDLTVESIHRIAAHYKQTENIGFIAIENLEMLRTHFMRIELSREREAVEIVAKLRGLARELEIPILLIAGLNDGPERRNKRFGFPKISDLPYSDLIIGLASTVSLLVRPAYYATCEDDRERLKDVAELTLCKNDHGFTDVLQLDFDSTCSRFTDSWYLEIK